MPSSRNSIDLPLAAALLVVVGLVVWQLRLVAASPPPVAVGTPLPTLKTVEGWVNVPAGETVDVDGEIVVVDCWATYCPQCITDLPEMVDIAAAYRPLGVKFIGATQETGRDLPRIEHVMKSTPGFDWPVAYGTSDFQNTMGFTSIPAAMVVGRDGRILWSGWGVPGLRDALDAALAADSMRAKRSAARETVGNESG